MNLYPLLEERKVDRYDGQTLFVKNSPAYELGNFLGGGSAGMVYEAENIKTKECVALKILNPIGFKLLPNATLQRFYVASKGKDLSAADTNNIKLENVWWLVHPNNKSVTAAYVDARFGGLRELSLKQCVEIWGWNPKGIEDLSPEEDVSTTKTELPSVPPKYTAFLKQRAAIHREISSMSKVGHHCNILQLYEVLELIQDTKSTIFLSLELAKGGELFDRIKADEGTQEDTARKYFIELLSGLAYCHSKGVCHRDLKPENLLLAENNKLKIADFGLSAIYADNLIEPLHEETQSSGFEMRRLRSVVGSPHYVAPEIMHDSVGEGYDGRKADVYSAGVILYAMLAGSLPFGKDFLQCPRFQGFKKWSETVRSEDNGAPLDKFDTYPDWFFPTNLSLKAKQLLVCLLDPNPNSRITIGNAAKHIWVTTTESSSSQEENDSSIAMGGESEGKSEIIGIVPIPMLSADANCESFILGDMSP